MVGVLRQLSFCPTGGHALLGSMSYQVCGVLRVDLHTREIG